MKSVKTLFVATTALFFVPFVAVAFTNFKSLVQELISNVLKPIVPFVVSLTVAYFLWGTAKYIMYAGEAAKREEGRKMMLNGIIALAVMTSFWGVAKILVNTFGF